MAKPNRGSDAADSLRNPWRSSETTERRAPLQPGRATFHLPAPLINEMRNAVVALSGPPHRLTMSKLAETAIRRELDRLRRQEGVSPQRSGFSQRSAEVTRGRPIR